MIGFVHKRGGGGIVRVLMVNKFLYPKGGAERYMLALGDALAMQGHRVEYFGMEDARNTVGNAANAFAPYTPTRFGSGGLPNPAALVYSPAAARHMRAALRRLRPHVVHMHNITYQLTPAVLYQAKRLGLPVVHTLHDAQLVCPGRALTLPHTGAPCGRCADGSPLHCARNRCVHGSAPQSLLAAAEMGLHRALGSYHLPDAFLVPSRFLARCLAAGGFPAHKMLVWPNFWHGEAPAPPAQAPPPYVLYAGRLCSEKGVDALLRVCRALPQVPFRLAGEGPLAAKAAALPNVRLLGFLPTRDLHAAMQGALFTVLPARVFENSPLAVVESLALGTPVVAAATGGLPELVRHGQNGLLYPAGDETALRDAILRLWGNAALRQRMRTQCLRRPQPTAAEYAAKTVELYRWLVQRRRKAQTICHEGDAPWPSPPCTAR